MRQRIFILLLILFAGILLGGYAQQDENIDKIKERIIYIPYTQLEKLIQKEDTGIYLPYKDYRKLIEELDQLKQRPPELPAMVVISNVSYQGKIVGEFLQIEASYTLNVFKEGWHGLELGFKEVAVKEASLDSEPALLKLKGDTYELIFKSERAEKRQFKITFVSPIQRTHSLQAMVQFFVPRAPIANLSLEIPSSQEANQETPKMKVEVYPSIMTQVESTKELTRVKALLGSSDSVKIVWESQVERRVEIKNIIHSENITKLDIGENYLHLRCKILYDLVQGEVSLLKVRIPKDFRVFSVSSLQGVGIKEWNLEEEETLLVVNLHGKLADQGEGKTDLEMELKLEKVIRKTDSKFSLPTVEILEVERETGFYTIGVDDLHTLQIVKRKDITQLEINELPGHVSKADIQFAFKYLHRPFVLDLELEKKKPEYEVATSVYAYLEETLYELYSCMHYSIDKSRIFGTRVEIPSGFVLLDAKAYDLSMANAEERETDRIKEYREIVEKGKPSYLEITFKKGIRSPQLFLLLHMQQKFSEEQSVREIGLPVFRAEDAKREKGHIGIGVKSSFSVTTVEKSQKNLIPLDINELFKDVPPFFKQAKRMEIKHSNIGFRYVNHPIEARFKIEKRDPLVTAEVYDYVDVQENVLKHDFRVVYDIKYTGVKEFSFTLPKHYPNDEKREIAKYITESRITDRNNLIKEKKIVPSKDQNSVLYTISTQRDMLGTYEIFISYEEKLGQIETSKEVPIFELVTQNTKRENGFILFKKNSNFSLEFDYKGLETADINDPAFEKMDKEGVLSIFKYNTHGFTMVMKMQKLAFEPVLNTVINRLHISTTVNKDYTSKNEAIILLVNNRKQMLEFEVPEDSEITSVSRLKNVFLFNLSLGNEYSLDTLSISSGMRNEFYRNGCPLSAHARISIKKKGVHWLLEDQGTSRSYSIMKNMEQNVLQVYEALYLPYSRNFKSEQIDKYFEALTWWKSEEARRFRVDIATNVQKEAPFILLIKYNCTLKKGEMENHGDFALGSLHFMDVPVTYFTWDLGLPREYQYVWFDSNLSKRFSYDNGSWSALYPLLSTGNVDTTDIKQDVETGVVPIYPIEGKLFSFSRLNGNGRIKVYFLSKNLLSALNMLAFILTCALVALLPKTGRVNRLTLVFILLAVSVFLASLNLQGYQDVYLTILIAAFLSGMVAMVIRFLQVIGARLSTLGPKPASPSREAQKQIDQKQEESKPGDDKSSH